MKKNYTALKAACVHYVGDEPTLSDIVDGVLERLAIAGVIDPEAFDGWPQDGMIAPLLADYDEVANG